MERETHLVFDEVIKTVQIVFGNGKESIAFDTKKEAIQAILDYLKKQKISEDEKENLINEILESEILPPSIGIVSLCVLAQTSNYKGLHLKACKCNGRAFHVHIHNEDYDCISNAIYTKETGFEISLNFFENEFITENEWAHLNELIRMVKKIPESAQMN